MGQMGYRVGVELTYRFVAEGQLSDESRTLGGFDELVVQVQVEFEAAGLSGGGGLTHRRRRTGRRLLLLLLLLLLVLLLLMLLLVLLLLLLLLAGHFDSSSGRTGGHGHAAALDAVEDVPAHRGQRLVTVSPNVQVLRLAALVREAHHQREVLPPVPQENNTFSPRK